MMKSGMLIIHKPQGAFSGKLSRDIGRKFKFKKVGHTGTLDPQATGVLVLCVNDATKMTPYLLSSDKEYEGILKLGITNTTQDLTGEVTHQSDLSAVLGLSDDDIRTQMATFVGKILQMPPMYSAVKVHGKALYKYARKNQEVERDSRETTIYDFRVTKREQDEVHFRVTCAKGTYVRTLCHDLGERLGVGGALASLTRLSAGIFRLEDAIYPDQLTPENVFASPHWKSVSDVFLAYPSRVVSLPVSQRIRRGISPHFNDIAEFSKVKDKDLVFLVDEKKAPLAIVRPRVIGQRCEIMRVFPSTNSFTE